MRRSELIHIIRESIKRKLLNESASDKAALKYLETQGITDYNEKMRIIGTLKHDVPNLRLDKGKFVTAGLRMYYSGELNNEQSIRTLDTVLNYIHKGNHVSEYDFNLNGLSLEELSSKYKDNIAIDRENDRKRSEQIQRKGGNGYTIIPIDTYEQASKYSEYTSWCVTHGQNAFDSYTKGGNRFYFCIMNGFENTPKNDEGAPLNTYGLSMISVEIDMNGDLLRITTRYNHDFNGENNEGLCSVEQLEDILDVNFYKVFLPYTREELHSRGIILFDEVQELLDSGKEPEEIFDYVGKFIDGYARIELNNKMNLISEDNRLLRPDIWFDYINNFSNGYAVVELNKKWNYIDTNGNYISELWFDYAWNFHDGYAMVALNDKWNWIDTNGNYLSEQWFDGVDDFNKNGYARVLLSDTSYKIDTNGQLYDEDTMQPINSPTTNNITLNELKHIIRESIKRQLLNEISIGDKYKKEQNRTRWSADEFQLICQSDPTYNRNKDIVGKYTNWLLNKLNSIEQLQQVRIPLEWYADGMKRGILQRSGVPTDINRFSNVNEFIETMNSVMHGDNNNQMSQSEYNNRKKLEGQFEIIGENADYEVIIPKTFDAERYFGSGTEWCTVANENYFKSYTKKGNLYIFYPKNGDKKLKMQFHIETKSYATYDDEVYNKPSKCVSSLYEGDEDKINTTLALCQKVFKGKIPEVLMINVTFDNVQSLLDKGYKPNEIFDDVSDFINGYARIRLNDKWNWISKDNRLVSPEQWFDSVTNFVNSYVNGWIDDTKYIVDTNGNVYYVTFDNAQELLYKGYEPLTIFDNVYEFFNGYACVYLNDKWNWISNDNNLVSPDQWFDKVYDFENGYACANIGYTKYFVDTKGKIVEEVTFDNVLELLDKGYNPYDIFDYVYGFYHGYACVRLNRKYNWISADNRLVSPIQWFDGVNNFNEKGYALAMIGNTKYIVDTNGQLYDYVTKHKINSQNTTNMTLNELKHIIRESIKRKLNKQEFQMDKC